MLLFFMHISEYQQLQLNEFAYKNGIKFIILFGSLHILEKGLILKRQKLIAEKIYA